MSDNMLLALNGHRLSLPDDEVDFDTGFILLPSAMPEAAPARIQPGMEQSDPPPSGVSEPPHPPNVPPMSPASPPATVSPAGTGSSIFLRFEANRDQVYQAFLAVANLADRADGGKILIQITAQAANGFDPDWYRNAVEEPLDEADIEIFSD